MEFVLVESVIEAFIPKIMKNVFDSQIRLVNISQKCSAFGLAERQPLSSFNAAVT